jgi:hypothetical protein
MLSDKENGGPVIAGPRPIGLAKNHEPGGVVGVILYRPNQYRNSSLDRGTFGGNSNPLRVSGGSFGRTCRRTRFDSLCVRDVSREPRPTLTKRLRVRIDPDRLFVRTMSD